MKTDRFPTDEQFAKRLRELYNELRAGKRCPMRLSSSEILLISQAANRFEELVDEKHYAYIEGKERDRYA